MRMRTVLVVPAIALLCHCSDDSGGSSTQDLTAASVKGSYAFTTTRSCAQTAVDKPMPSIDDPFEFDSRNVARLTGTLVYDGNGGGSITGGVAISINYSSPSPGKPMNVAEFTCTFKYTVANGFLIEDDYTCPGMVVAGGGKGNMTTSSGLHTVRRIVQGGSSLISSEDDAQPAAETVVQTGTPAGTFYRLCARSSVALRL